MEGLEEGGSTCLMISGSPPSGEGQKPRDHNAIGSQLAYAYPRFTDDSRREASLLGKSRKFAFFPSAGGLGEGGATCSTMPGSPSFGESRKSRDHQTIGIQ